MQALKKSMIAAALVGAGFSTGVESNPPVYWPAVAMMPVQYGSQSVMIPVSGWITPRGFLPAFAAYMGQATMAGNVAPQAYVPGAAFPPPPGMIPGAVPGGLAGAHGLPSFMPPPNAMPWPGIAAMAPQMAHGGTTVSVPGMMPPGMFPPGMVPPGPVGFQGVPGSMVPGPFPSPAFVSGLPVPQPQPQSVVAMRPDSAAVIELPKAAESAPAARTETAMGAPQSVVPAAGPEGVAGATRETPAPAVVSPPLRTEAAMVAVPLTITTSDAPGGFDRDGDGVQNDADLCPDKSGPERDLGCPANEGVSLGGIVFRYDSDELTDESKGILDRVADKLMRMKAMRLEVAGHTDARGDAMYNLDLSERRARAVRDYLLEQGVNPSRLTAKGYGQTRPLADNESRAGRASNRRVELRPV